MESNIPQGQRMLGPRLLQYLGDASNKPPSKRTAPPALIPYASGPPILSPWCTETHALETGVARSACPYRSGLTISD